jgi:hypothetical protein
MLEFKYLESLTATARGEDASRTLWDSFVEKGLQRRELVAMHTDEAPPVTEIHFFFFVKLT